MIISKGIKKVSISSCFTVSVTGFGNAKFWAFIIDVRYTAVYITRCSKPHDNERDWNAYPNGSGFRTYLKCPNVILFHYHDVIMSAMVSHITDVSVVYSTDCSGVDQSKTSKLRVTGLCEGNSPVTGEFPAQRASDMENVSIASSCKMMSRITNARV